MERCKQITLTVKIEEDEGHFAAYCVELGTATCGETYKEAEKNIFEAIAVDLKGLDEAGITDKFFKERGIKVEELELERKPEKISFEIEPCKAEATYRLALCT